MNQNIQSLIRKIATITYNSVPVENWEKALVEIKMISAFAELSAVYRHHDEEFSFDPESAAENGEDITELFIALRKSMYELNPGAGAWYAAVIQISSEGKFNVSYDYDNKPAFTYEPSRDKYETEAREFPREEGLTPAWLKQILES